MSGHCPAAWELCWEAKQLTAADADPSDGAQVDTARVTIGGRQAFGCIAMPDFLSALAKAVKPNGAHSSAHGVAACRHVQEVFWVKSLNLMGASAYVL